MDSYWFTLVGSFVGGGLATHVFDFFASKSKRSVEIDVTVSGAWRDFVEEQKERTKKLEEQNQVLSEQVMRLQEENLKLKEQLISLANKVEHV